MCNFGVIYCNIPVIPRTCQSPSLKVASSRDKRVLRVSTHLIRGLVNIESASLPPYPCSTRSHELTCIISVYQPVHYLHKWVETTSGSADKKDCCARKVLAAEQDFREQKGQLREELEARGQVVLFLPKFHCELNPIEPYWCQAKWYCRENCEYTISGLRDTVPKALASVQNSTILGFWNRIFRVIDAYQAGMNYGTEEFKNRAYRSHRRIEDKSKW